MILRLCRRHPMAIALYLLLLAGIVWGIFSARERTIAVYGTPQAQAEWDKWRAAAASQNSGPVKRRSPESVAPPALVLMRDHFGVVLAAGVVFGTALYVVLALLVGGVAKGDAHERGKDG